MMTIQLETAWQKSKVMWPIMGHQGHSVNNGDVIHLGK